MFKTRRTRNAVKSKKAEGNHRAAVILIGKTIYMTYS